MRIWKTITIGEFLKERPDRIKHEDANQLLLQRIKKIDFSGNIHLADKTETKTTMIVVKQGDLVISGINVEKGAIAVYEDNEDVLATIHYSSYEFDEQIIDIDFLKWFLMSTVFMDVLKEQVGGGIKTELKPKNFLPLSVKIPSLEIQMDIARKINSLKSEARNISESFIDTVKLVQSLRQSILQEAFQGNIVPQDNRDEPASFLLEKIKIEKENLIKDKKFKKEIPLPPIAEDEIPYELPQNWEWVRLGDVAIHSLGKMLDHQKNKGEYQKYLRNLNVKWFNFELEDILQMRFEKDKQEQFLVRKGDLLICEGGYPGRAAIWEEDYTIFIQKALHRVRFLFPNMNYYFLYFLFLSDINGTLKKYYTGSGIKHLTGKSLGKLLLPIPPINEQKRIVEKVDQLMALCTELERTVEQSMLESEMLMQAVLQEAFSATETEDNVVDFPVANINEIEDWEIAARSDGAIISDTKTKIKNRVSELLGKSQQ